MTTKGNSDTLIKLISSYSPSGEETKAVDYLVGRMQQLNFDKSFVDDVGNAIGVLGIGPRQIVLLGHIDTVSGAIPVRIDNGNLYGRGAVDAKGSLAAFVEAAASVGRIPGWKIIVIGAVDEERDSVGARFVVDQYRPEFAIIGEPSGWDRITLGYKGSARANLRVNKEKSHSAGKNPSASEIAFKYWTAIQNWQKEYNLGIDKLFNQLQISLEGISSGDDGFEEWAKLQIGSRLPVGISPESIYENLRKITKGNELRSIGYPISACLCEKNNALVRAFTGAIRGEDAKPGFVLKTGTADLNIVSPIWQCPALAYGPGDSSLDHTPDEHINLEEYKLSIKVLIAVIKRLVR